ncbi:B3 domain-containing protein Os11g0197600-like [Papaver somniferum]|uniref:B3 domain-containing protein Os11g0197600-like n=1 Tax=Papaver somniferum TaxID=3469 RepID=UPI000E6F7A24|nr:B3 domain-containing protein Os11g0197600-like [Papaver somniferum]
MEKKKKKKKKMGSHFFKIICNYIIQDRRLELPKKIVRIFGEELGKAGLIEDPTGKIWPVEIRKAEGEIYFQSGWQEFREYFSISVGHFLIFRYVGDSHFHVSICDKTACEIEYPCQPKNVHESKHRSMENDQNTAANQAGPSFVASKRNRYEDYQKAGGSVKRNKSDGFEEYTGKRWASFKRHLEVVTISSDGESDDEDYQNPGDSAEQNESEEIETISCRPCAKRHLEMVTISSDGESNDEDYQNHVDSEPRAVNFEGDPEVVTINSESSDKRPMDTQHRSASHKGKYKIAKMVSYAEHKADVSECRSGKAMSAIGKARAFKSEFPTCTIVIKQSHLQKHSLVHVPYEFSRDFLTKAGEVTLKDSTGKKWRVEYYYYRSGGRSSCFKANLCKGWYEFVLDNHLKVDDACVFELVDTDNLEMKVNIFRVSPDMAFNTLKPDSESDDEHTMPTQTKSAIRGGNRKISKTGEVKVWKNKCQRAMGDPVNKEATAFKSEFPTCRIIMKPSYLLKGYTVHVPFQFARDFLTNRGDDSVTLKDSTGKKWHVRYKTYSSEMKAILSKGWYVFVLDNHLKVNDACIFELDDIDNLEMKVNIFRASPDMV